MKNEYRNIKEFMRIERPADKFSARGGSAMVTCCQSSYFDSEEGVRKHNAMQVTALNLVSLSKGIPDSNCAINSTLSYIVDPPTGETWVNVQIRAGIPKDRVLKELECICEFIKSEWQEG